MILLAFVALLGTQDAAHESPLSRSLDYLARHQRPDGSWGERPEKCTCPLDRVKPSLPCEPEKVAPLLRALRDDNPATRDGAEKSLRSLGDSVLPYLEAALKDSDAEVQARCARLISYLNQDLLNYGDAELTGLALLAFLGAGYTHLSKDERNGQHYGKVVKNGLRWLLTRQNQVDTFDPDSPVGDVIATLAVAEDDWATATGIVKDPLERAIARQVRSPATSVRGLIWKGIALKSAEMAEVPFPKEAYAPLEEIRSKEGAQATAGYAVLYTFTRKRKDHAQLAELERLDPTSLDVETTYIASLAAFQVDGPDGSFWKSWKKKVQGRLEAAQCPGPGKCPRGSWDGETFRARLKATALDGMNFEFTFR